MSKNCIFNENKLCNDCKECELCELDRKKVCNNCGKCLELEGYDIRAIKIDEVFENKEDEKEKINIDIEEFSDFDLEDDNLENDSYDLKEEATEYVDVFDNEENLSYIDDVEELKELLDEGKELGDEVCPGLITYKKNK
ncbi:hypothetical protein [Clostridium senegalense]|uniref:hypothetical protein n=1 Tax=Clostridium senegalense TaxID=1465809 RepID=UPI001C12066B|nr:hypothetical protein [Clostridium senegalense]MBU5227750.1 hypothetical protein [Clostridium senegalense]